MQDKYWDSDTLSYKRTTAVPAAEQKRLPEQIASIIERAEKTFTDKADSRWMRQVIEDVLYPARAFERNHPNLLARVHEYLEKFDGAERTKEHIVRFERKMTRYHDYRREILGEADFTLFVETVTLEQMNAFRDYVVNEHLFAAGTSRLLRSPHAHQPQAETAFRHDRHQHHEFVLHLPALVQEDEVFRQRGLCPLRL